MPVGSARRPSCLPAVQEVGAGRARLGPPRPSRSRAPSCPRGRPGPVVHNGGPPPSGARPPWRTRPCWSPSPPWRIAPRWRAPFWPAGLLARCLELVVRGELHLVGVRLRLGGFRPSGGHLPALVVCSCSVVCAHSVHLAESVLRAPFTR